MAHIKEDDQGQKWLITTGNHYGPFSSADLKQAKRAIEAWEGDDGSGLELSDAGEYENVYLGDEMLASHSEEHDEFLVYVPESEEPVLDIDTSEITMEGDDE